MVGSTADVGDVPEAYSSQHQEHTKESETNMEWLEPHISRINQFCKSLDNRHALLHIPKAIGHESTTEKEYFNISRKELQDNERLAEKLLRYREYAYYDDHERYVNEIPRKRQKIQPVSVIVTEKSLSSSSGSNSSASSPNSTSHDDKSKINESYDDETRSNSSAKENSMDGLPLEKNDDTNKEKPGRKSRSEYNYKPAPMVRKSQRNFISAEKKDSVYWERRRRNNEAAKKSRESRREKEIEVNLKCAKLEKENSELRYEVMSMRDRNTELESTLNLYKNILIKNNLL